MAERVDLIGQVMHWEAEAIAAKDFLKEVKFTRVLDIANEVDEALAKCKNSDDFAVLLKKDHDTGFDTGVEAIFYNILGHYQGLDYASLGGEMTDIIGEWLEEERLNAPNVMPSSTSPGLLTENAVEIETVPAEASEQQPAVEVDEETIAPNPPLTFKDPASELSLRVAAIQLLTNLEEEPVATDVEEEPEAAIDCTAV